MCTYFRGQSGVSAHEGGGGKQLLYFSYPQNLQHLSKSRYFVFTFANSFKRKAGPDSKETKENILNSPNQISLYTQGEEFQHVWEEQKLHFIKQPPALYFCNSKALYIWKIWAKNFHQFGIKCQSDACGSEKILWKDFNTNYLFPISPSSRWSKLSLTSFSPQVFKSMSKRMF